MNPMPDFWHRILRFCHFCVDLLLAFLMRSCCVLALIFFPGGNAAAEMALGFIDLQNLLDLEVKATVEFGQTFAQILMYSGFADGKPLCGGADRSPVLDHVLSERDGTLLDISFQATTLPASYCSILCAVAAKYVPDAAGTCFSSFFCPVVLY